MRFNQKFHFWIENDSRGEFWWSFSCRSHLNSEYWWETITISFQMQTLVSIWRIHVESFTNSSRFPPLGEADFVGKFQHFDSLFEFALIILPL